MAIEHQDGAWEHSRQSGSGLVVLLAVARFSDQRGEWTVDQATLQKRTRLGRRRVQQVLGELVAAGELAVVSHHGRGKLSTYRLLVGVEKAKQSAAPFQEGEAQCAFPAHHDEAECAFSTGKGEAECALPAPLSPPCPPLPPFPPDPLIPLYPQIPPTPLPEKQKLETFGLRPLTGPQGGVCQVNLLLEEAGAPLPSPAQIGLWSKTLGGIEPLLALLGRLVQAGLANKRQPIAYVHRVVMEQAARPQPGKPLDARAGRELLWSAGADDIRRAQALRIIAGKRGVS